MDNPTLRPVIYLVGLASIFLILFGIRDMASIINPILLAIVITITVLPIPGRLTRKGIPGWLALVLTILLVVLILGLVILTVFLSVTRLATDLPTYMVEAQERIAEELSALASSQETQTPTTQIVVQAFPLLQQVMINVGNLIVQFGISLLIFFFMISAAISLPAPTRLGMNLDVPIISQVASLTEGVRGYMTILTGVNLAVGMGNTVLLWILGVDYALLWGILAWFMGYIPSIGFFIALIPPLLLAWAEFGITTALIVLIGYILINGGVQNFIQPRIMGQNLKISPVVVFISLFIWGFLLGGIGAILAVPLTLLVLTLMEHFEGTRTVAVLLRYTGEEKKEERAKAIEQVKGLWGKARETFISKKETTV